MIKMIVLFVFLALLIYCIKKYVIYRKRKNKSIEDFLKKVNKAIKMNNVVVSKEYDFNREIKYQKRVIPLGKVIFDFVNKKVLIYETFISKIDHFICIPDINFFSYENLLDCSVFCENNILEDFDNDYFLNNKEKILLKLNFSGYVCESLLIRFLSINDYELFIKLYQVFKQIVLNNKKIA